MTRNQRKLHPVLWVAVGIAGVLILLAGMSVRSATTSATPPETVGGLP